MVTLCRTTTFRMDPLSLDSNILDPNYNCDFTKLKDTGTIFKRGIELLSTSSRNTTALTDGGVRVDSKDGEWPVSYHGTKKEFAEKIAADRYDLNKGRRFQYGRGIYSTPDPDIAEKYAQVYEFKGHKYKILLQNRVNKEDTALIASQNYFVTKNAVNYSLFGDHYF